ncbi:cytochrome c biogenesis protein ResB [Lampropedia cohaerens]|uniref:cytochrome c biogenesis protein ResB n=1 Tax=Lampropedia cohaerens TaxID=1610491 RepID=UPI0018D27316|nr:cytochrome c biogenesis protein ResB [Lampropedia cohaerens]
MSILSASWWRSAHALLASMRFAIVLLTVLSIASVAGTVLRQQQPLASYVETFGPFWAQLFITLQLHAVYSAWWFVLILAFLVLSTSLCIARNAPKYLADMRRYHEKVRVGSLRAMPLHAQGTLDGAPQALAHDAAATLAAAGWRVRLHARQAGAMQQPGGWMVAAKRGAAHKLGYIATHGAIVLICAGALIDGELFIRAQAWWGGKTPFTSMQSLGQAGAEHWLSPATPAYRGLVRVAEGAESATAIVTQGDGVLLQPLPFRIGLQRFEVDYYSSGMPRAFTSEVVIEDLAGKQRSSHRIAVNQPLRIHGVDIYQSGFDDGGSRVRLRAVGLRQRVPQTVLEAEVGKTLPVGALLPGTTLEVAQLRVLNVENLGGGDAVDVRRVDLRSTLATHLGAGNKTTRPQVLRNVGPSITYRLRDAAGQAVEFHNYMLAADLDDGVPVYLLGVRQQPSEPMRYVRIPQDSAASMDDFLRLQRALYDAPSRAQAVAAYVSRALVTDRTDLRAQLEASARRAMALFVGEGAPAPQGRPTAGLQALAQFIQNNVSPEEMESASAVLLRMLQGVLFELLQQQRQADGLAALAPEGPAMQSFMRLALLALSDMQAYPADVFFALEDFTQVQASVFQVTKAPGRPVVYLGCVLLIAGVFMMLFVRERRLWLWLQPDVDGTAAQALLAMATNRRTLDAGQEFKQLQQTLLRAQSPSLKYDESHDDA